MTSEATAARHAGSAPSTFALRPLHGDEPDALLLFRHTRERGMELVPTPFTTRRLAREVGGSREGRAGKGQQGQGVPPPPPACTACRNPECMPQPAACGVGASTPLHHHHHHHLNHPFMGNFLKLELRSTGSPPTPRDHHATASRVRSMSTTLVVHMNVWYIRTTHTGSHTGFTYPPPSMHSPSGPDCMPLPLYVV